MAASDVFVHPARFEPFGIVYTEALALGLPIVATACPGGPVDVLDHGEFGRLVPTGEPAALADAIVEISEDRELRRTLAERGPGRAGAYAPAAIARQMVRLADKVASHAPDLDAPEGSVAR
jgi:glycosyltransferase involved in cell wall biosynthesis